MTLVWFWGTYIWFVIRSSFFLFIPPVYAAKMLALFLKIETFAFLTVIYFGWWFCSFLPDFLGEGSVMIGLATLYTPLICFLFWWGCILSNIDGVLTRFVCCWVIDDNLISLWFLVSIKTVWSGSFGAIAATVGLRAVNMKFALDTSGEWDLGEAG